MQFTDYSFKVLKTHEGYLWRYHTSCNLDGLATSVAGVWRPFFTKLTLKLTQNTIINMIVGWASEKALSCLEENPIMILFLYRNRLPIKLMTFPFPFMPSLNEMICRLCGCSKWAGMMMTIYSLQVYQMDSSHYINGFHEIPPAELDKDIFESLHTLSELESKRGGKERDCFFSGIETQMRWGASESLGHNYRDLRQLKQMGWSLPPPCRSLQIQQTWTKIELKQDSNHKLSGKGNTFE